MRRPRAVIASMAFAFLSALVADASADVIERRGAEPRLEGTIDASAIDPAGVSIVTEFGARHTVPWDRIRRVMMASGEDRRVRERAIQRYADIAEQLWRARSRVERGDVSLAAPLLERLFERYRGQTSETALVVSEGLLRCRLAQGANALAVIPALETMRLRRAGVQTRSYAMLDSVWDADLELVPELPPVWASSPALQAVLSDLEGLAVDDPVVTAMARAYARAMRQHLDESPAKDVAPIADRRARGHRGVQLLSLMADALDADPSVRSSALERLVAIEDDLPSAFRSWARAGEAAVDLQSTSRPDRQAGVVILLEIAIEDGARAPYLGGVALAIARTAAARDFGDDVADSLAAALREQYPTHPIMRNPRPMDWPPLERGSDE